MRLSCGHPFGDDALEPVLEFLASAAESFERVGVGGPVLALVRFDAPIFIRFAGEMNGEWTPYHGDPELYRQKFRLVYRVLKAAAPKTALIW